MKRVFDVAGWLIVGSLLSIGCAKRTWVKDLAVAPGTSPKKGQVQVIRFVKVSESRDLGQKFWVAGEGYAQINGGSGAYFWMSSRNGIFQGTESPQGFLGVFKLESLTKCELVPAN